MACMESRWKANGTLLESSSSHPRHDHSAKKLAKDHGTMEVLYCNTVAYLVGWY